jgi:hypothetical protein
MLLERQKKFVTTDVQMQHVHQPVMLSQSMAATNGE